MLNLINSVVPPILIVVSLSLLIAFLVKVIPKSQKRLEKDQENRRVRNNINNEENLNKEEKFVNLNERDDVFKVQKKLNFFSQLVNFFSDKYVKFKKNKSNTYSKNLENNTGVIKDNNLYNKEFDKNFTLESKVELKEENAKNNQVSTRMGEILLNDKNSPNNLSVKINEESELIKQIKLDPKNSESYRHLGDFYVQNDRLQEARECYRWVLRLDPRHKRAQLAMARLDRILA